MLTIQLTLDEAQAIYEALSEAKSTAEVAAADNEERDGTLHAIYRTEAQQCDKLAQLMLAKVKALQK